MSKFSVRTIFLGIDKMTAPIRKMDKNTQKFITGMNRGLHAVNGALSGVTAGVQKFGATVAVVGAATIAMIADVSAVGGEFEQTIVNASAKFGIFNRRVGEGRAQFKLLEDSARSMGKTTEFTAIQSAEALKFLGQAGFSANQGVATLPGILDLATVSGLELAQASDIATDALSSFGLKTKNTIQLTKNMTRVNDVFSKAADSATLSVDQIYEAMVKGGPAVTQAGFKIEDFAAITGVLADQALKGSAAGTGIAAMFRQMANPTEKARRILNHFKVDIADADGNFRDMVDIVRDLKPALSGLGTVAKTAALNEIFGRQGGSAMVKLLNAGADELDRYTKSLINAGGHSEKVATTMRDTFAVSWLNVKALIDDVKISMFEFIKEPLKDLFRGFKEWIGNNKKLFDSIGKTFKWLLEHPKLILSVVSVITILVTSLTALATVIGVVSGAMAILNFLMIANPVTLTIAGITAAITGLIAVAAVMAIYWDEWTTYLREMNPLLKGSLLLLLSLINPWAGLAAAIALVVANFDDLPAPFKDFLLLFSFGLEQIWEDLSNIGPAFEDLGFHLLLGVETIVDGFKTAFGAIGDFVSGIWNSITKTFEESINITMLLIDKMVRASEKARTYIPEFAGGISDEEFEKRDAEREARQQNRGVEVLGPQAVISKELKERRDSAELTIRDETNKTEVTKGSIEAMTNINLLQSGAF